MDSQTETRLIEAMEYCEKEDKSTEFMIQYMMDYAGVDHDCVNGYPLDATPARTGGKIT